MSLLHVYTVDCLPCVENSFTFHSFPPLPPSLFSLHSYFPSLPILHVQLSPPPPFPTLLPYL